MVSEAPGHAIQVRMQQKLAIHPPACQYPCIMNHFYVVNGAFPIPILSHACMLPVIIIGRGKMIVNLYTLVEGIGWTLSLGGPHYLQV